MRFRGVSRLCSTRVRTASLSLLLQRRTGFRRARSEVVVTAAPRPATSIDAAAVDLSARMGNLALRHPVMTASGCFAYGQQFATFMDLRELAGLATKGISPRPRPGNPLPRICETA